METKTPNTREEQDQAHNPSQKNVDREFQRIADNDTFDDMMNSNGLGQDLKNAEQRAGENAGNATKNSDKSANDNNASKNVSNAKNSEQSWDTNVSANNKSAKQE